ncbi:MAG: hypothetical protein ABIP06_03570 [Pyrinomonadaceae bacterium]
MKKIPVWFLITMSSFIIGIIAVILWTIPSFVENIEPPAEICLSNKFPGNSISIGELEPQDHSVFTKSKISDQSESTSERNAELFTSFQEEPFEKDKFQNGKAFPELAMAGEIYRFFWLRTFHNPIMIRLYRIGDKKYIVAKQTDGRGGYETGKLVFNKTRQLSDEEWCKFIILLDQANFWTKSKIDVSHLANDGAFWNVEGVRDGRYYITGEQSPRTGKFRDACIYLMRISGLDINETNWEFY